MAKEEQILIEVKFDTKLVEEAREKLAASLTAVKYLKDEQKELNKTIQEQGYATKEQSSQLAQLNKQIDAATRAQKSNTAVLQAATLETYNNNASLDEQRQYLNTLQKAYASMDKEQMEMAGGQELLQKKIKDVSDALKEQEHAIGEDGRNVGNYTESILKAGSGAHDLADAFKVSSVATTGMGKATDSLDKAMKLAAKNPWMAVISLLLPLLQQLFKALMGNEKAMAEVKKIMDALGQVFKQFEPIITKVANILTNVLGKAFEFIISYITTVLKGIDWLAKKLGFNLNLAGVFDSAINGASSATEAVDDMATNIVNTTSKMAKATEDNAKKMEEALAKQREEMERRTRTALENELADLEKARDEELAIEGLTAEEKLAIEEYYEKQMQEKRDAYDEAEAKRAEDAAKKAEADAKKLADEEKRIADARIKLADEANNMLQELNIRAADDEHERRLEQLQEYYEQGVITEEELIEAKKRLNEQNDLERAEAVVNNAKQVLSIMSTLNDMVSTIENDQLDDYKKGQDARKKELEKRLKAGEISEEQYNKEVQSLDAETAQKEKELNYEQAKREKAMAIMNATLNAAAAIIASLAQSPIAIGPVPNPAGIASLALATTMGIVQVAAAAATPLPKFATGGIVGGSDYNDGIVARISSGEMVLNKGQQAQLFDALSSSNNGDNMQLGFNYEAMAAANAALPAPVMDYTEFKEFDEQVLTYNEIAKV